MSQPPKSTVHEVAPRLSRFAALTHTCVGMGCVEYFEEHVPPAFRTVPRRALTSEMLVRLPFQLHRPTGHCNTHLPLTYCERHPYLAQSPSSRPFLLPSIDKMEWRLRRRRVWPKRAKPAAGLSLARLGSPGGLSKLCISVQSACGSLSVELICPRHTHFSMPDKEPSAHSQIAVFPRNDALTVAPSRVAGPAGQIAPLLPPSRALSSFGLAAALDLPMDLCSERR
jgi:hypothetical protein